MHVFEKTSAEGGRLHASIDRKDALPADNSAWAILPRRARQRVILVTPGNLFLEKVFEAIPLVDLEVVKVSKDGPPDKEAAKAWQVGAKAIAPNEPPPIVVFHHKVPDALPPCPVFVIEPERAGSLWELGELVQNPLVAKQDKESPLMLHIRLDNVLMPEARKLTLRTPAKVLAESSSGDPLYAVLERSPGAGEGAVVVLTVNLDKSDLPLQTAFPIMTANLLNWFGGTKGELREALPAGTVTQVEIPAVQKDGDKSLARFLLAPDGREQPCFTAAGCAEDDGRPARPLRNLERDRARRQEPCPKRNNRSLHHPARKPRVPRRTWRARRPFSPSLPATWATVARATFGPARASRVGNPGLAAGFAVRPIWYYLLVTALMLTCWEWFLYQRRWID